MSDSGRKINKESDNFIDNAFTEASDKLSPYFRKIGYTANGITTLSIIFGLGSVYYINNRDIYPFILCYAIYYFLDVMDGYYARKYNMKSDFGAHYDVWRDIVINIILAYVIYNKYDVFSYPILLCILLFIVLMGGLFVGCQEKWCDNDKKSFTLKIFDDICPDKVCDDYGTFISYFGPGITVAALLLTVWYIHTTHMTQIIR